MRRLPRVHGYYGKLRSRKRQDCVSEKSSDVAQFRRLRRAVCLEILSPTCPPRGNELACQIFNSKVVWLDV